MKKIIEFCLFVLSIVVFCLGGLVSISFEFFPVRTPKNALFSNLFYIKQLFNDKYFWIGLKNTYLKAIIPAIIFAVIFVAVVCFLKKKPSRILFYLVGFSGCALSSLAFIFYRNSHIGLPEYYYSNPASLVLPESSFSTSITANLFTNIFASLLFAVLTMLLCWIVELVYNRIKE